MEPEEKTKITNLLRKGASEMFHAHSFGEIHSKNHDIILFCSNGEYIANDSIADKVCKILNKYWNVEDETNY